MTLDQRAREATSSVQHRLEALEIPEPHAVLRKARHRRQAFAGVGLATIALFAVGAFVVVDDDPPTNSVEVAEVPTTVSPLTSGWNQLPTPPLEPRNGATAVSTGSDVIVVGGNNFLCPPGADCGRSPDWKEFADGAAFNMETRTWRPITPAPFAFGNSPSYAVVAGDIYIATQNELLRYRPVDDEWDTLPKPPDGIVGNLLATEMHLVSYAGSDEQGERTDWMLDLATMQWSTLPDDPMPAMFDRQMVWDGTDFLLFAKSIAENTGDGPVVHGARLTETGWEPLPDAPGGGYQAWLLDGLVVLNSHFGPDGGGIFDPAIDEWSALPAHPAGSDWNGDMAGALGSTTAFYEYTYGSVFGLEHNRWIEIPAETGLPDAMSTTAVGRSLFAFGGERWNEESNGTLSNDAWLWVPPAS
jgi:hypothetical protein